MRLNAPDFVHFIPSSSLSEFNKIGIKTTADLLFGHSALEIISRLPPGTISLKDLQTYMKEIAESTSAKGASALEISKGPAYSYAPSYLSSHCSNLDTIVGGRGFDTSRVFEISGDHKSGKTILALNIGLHVLLDDPESEVVWIDTNGDFSPDLSVRVVESERFPSTTNLDARFEALERLQIATAVDIESIYQVLQVVTNRLRLPSSEHPRTRCIVIDTITSVLGPFLSPNSSQGHAIMTTFMRQLQSIARTHLIAVFVINNATGIPRNQSNNVSMFPANVKRPSLGASFPFLTDATLWLSRPQTEIVDNVPIHSTVVEVLRSRVSSSNLWCKLKVIEEVVTN
ncbi:P-loop containing nucleoside triphosphate hydrolase protein [Marasmius fiardii PR-910]|nr:P-loop containing nucleoside triphosphate hydrolase protein [Marasmius fiardii PR-910]